MTEIRTSSEITVRLIDSMGGDTSVLASMMVSTQGPQSLDLIGRDLPEAEGKINFLMSNRHGTPFEHNAMTFFVRAPIAVFREWHRHRIGFSYNEESARYKVMEPDFYIPPAHRPLVQVGKPGHYTFEPGTDAQYRQVVESMTLSFGQSYAMYETMLAAGVAKEVARGVLPVYLYTSMYCTLNARSLMAFLSLRTKDPDAQFPSFPMWEIEQAGLKMEEAFKRLFPITAAAFRRHGSVCP